MSMLAEETLNSYLASMDKEMIEQYEILLEQYRINRHITEGLKRDNQLRWVQEMNNIKSIFIIVYT